MKPKTSKKELEKLVKQSGKSLADLTLAEAVSLMLDFYRKVRADGCPFDAEGDMLLFQWGAYDSGTGETFQCELTRQFAEAELEDDDALSGLSLTCHFPATAQTAALKDGNQWCHSPDELADFEVLIKANPAFQALEASRPIKFSLEYSAI